MDGQSRPIQIVLKAFLAVGLCLFTFPAQAQVAEQDSLTLVALYYATDGSNWTQNDNWLNGSVPTWFGITVRRNRVEEVRLAANNLSGKIPSLMHLYNLRSLDLSHNELTGSIPSSIGYLTRLSYLNLSRNQFTGEVPSSLAFIWSLERIILDDNPGLSGVLPINLIHQSRLNILGFSGTNVCEPSDPEFQSWIQSVGTVNRTGCTAQVPQGDFVGNCSRSLAETELDANNVRARLVNTGGLFYRGEPHVYNVPKGTDSNAIFSAALWVGGLVKGELRMSATRYGPWELWAGPLDDAGNPPDDCSRYDRIYKINLDDVLSYEASGILTNDLLEWPTGLGAPTVDRDGAIIDIMHLPFDERKERLIDLENGEQPLVYGNQAVWWIMNDRGNHHGATKTLPLGIEVHVLAFAAKTAVDVIDNTTFYQYRIFNRSAFDIRDMYVGLFIDSDLGDAGDDYVGSDSTLGLGYTYNADNEDIAGEGYFTPPPAVGVILPIGPEANEDGLDNGGEGARGDPGERLRVTTVGTWSGGGGVNEDPGTGPHYYNYMQGKWKDGRRVTVGGNGFEFSNIGTNWFYPGDPTTGDFWSEINADGLGNANYPADRKFHVSSGPFLLDSGNDTDFTFAIPWAIGKDHLDSVTELKRAAWGIQTAFSDGFDSLAGLIPRAAVQPDPSFDLAVNLGHA